MAFNVSFQIWRLKANPLTSSAEKKKKNSFLFLPCVFFQIKSLVQFFCSKSAIIFHKTLLQIGSEFIPSLPRDSPLTAAATGPHGFPDQKKKMALHVANVQMRTNFMPVSAMTSIILPLVI